ncbi:MAG: ADP-ribosylglycohydrolase family protein [Bacilli bacterium]
MKQFKAAYYGFLVGDAMGVPLESTERNILIEHPVTKMLGYGGYDVPAGAWSDDSSMMIATIDSISACSGIDYNDMMDKFSEWINFSKYTSVGLVFGAGRTTLKAIMRYQEGMMPLEAGLEGINYNGNGSLMRIMPVAFYAYVKGLTENEIIDLVCDVSSLTHAHEISCLGCYIYVRYVMFLLDGFDKMVCYEIIKKLDYSAFSDESIRAYRRLLFDDIANYSIEAISSSGYVVDTLEAVIWCINNTDSYKQAVIGAINLGDDTDTVGALTGALAGIIYGYGDIPKKWINKLQKSDYLKLIYTSFVKTMANLK